MQLRWLFSFVFANYCSFLPDTIHFMKFSRFIFLNGALITILASSLISSAQENYDQKLDCFTVIAGKNATEDGSVILAHNEDTGGERVVNYFKVPRTTHGSNEKITLMNSGHLNQANTTNAYFWVNLPGAKVCDSYVNEFGVAICSDGCPSKEKNPELTDGGILYWLRRVVAERARTAKEGVKIAGALIDKYGYADTNEGWTLCVVNGKHWIAARVPDDEVAVIPNYYIVGKVNLSDTTNFLGSPDIIGYAIKQGWYDPATDGDFHFAKAYAKPGSLTHRGNSSRMWRGVNLISGKDYKLNDEFPYTIKPKNKISVKYIMSILSDHYEDTELDNSKHYTLGNPYELNKTPICAKGTQYSLIAQLKGWMPNNFNSCVWITTFRPDAQAYLPYYVCMDDTPEFQRHTTYKMAINNQFNPSQAAYDNVLKHTYWINKTLAENTDLNYEKNLPLVRSTWDKIEYQAQRKAIRLEKKVLKIYQKDPRKAEELIGDFSKKMSTKVYVKTEKLVRQSKYKE